jgi:hypothetical protein
VNVSLDTQTPQNSPETATPSPESIATSADASPSTPATAAPAVERPSWLTDDALFDPEKGVKLDELGARFKELSEKASEAEKIAAERKANIPEKPDDYGFDLPEGYKLPEGVTGVDKDNPLWKVLQETALASNMTKGEYAGIAAKFLDGMAAAEKSQAVAYKNAQAELFKALGPNGDARADAVKTWLNTAFGEQVGKQMSMTLFTPDIVKSFEKIQKALTGQNVVSFNANGREAGGEAESMEGKTFREKWLASAKSGG